MHIEIAMLSKPGGRPRNEDACGYWTSDAGCCWVVCDGAGGHAGGDIASRTAVSAMLRDFAARPEVTPEALVDLLVLANEAVLAQQHAHSGMGDMRTTAAILMIDQVRACALWGHLGDTRIYCYRNGQLVLQTRDHSVMQSMIDAGLGDPSMLRNHPGRSVLLYALGSEEEMEPSVAQAPVALRPGDVFLMCTDGFWDYVDEAAMEGALAVSGSAEEWLAAMEAELLARAPQDHDNYTALTVWIRQALPDEPV